MECPICNEKVDVKPIEKNALMKRYKCPSCEKFFSKKTILNRGLRIAGSIALMSFFGSDGGDSMGGTS